jgi:hypothetical protein
VVLVESFLALMDSGDGVSGAGGVPSAGGGATTLSNSEVAVTAETAGRSEEIWVPVCTSAGWAAADALRVVGSPAGELCDWLEHPIAATATTVITLETNGVNNLLNITPPLDHPANQSDLWKAAL